MTYRYGIKNTYRPSSLAPRAYGWGSGPQYNRADVPTGLMDTPQNLTNDQFRQQFAYEWFQAGSAQRGFTNPPFVSGAAGRLHPALTGANGGSPKILRGYIRRSQSEAADPLSQTRLYFMFNPDTITRDYVSYLESSALDPFNTVYQSGNLVAPPSILDFTFSLFFDREEEAAQDAQHPGVFVDYQYFDMVVRNVVPDANSQYASQLPDNGVMMVNPRDITVIFSPQMTVQGRPLNARVSFVKFTHRMVPTRMQVDLTIRANYLGPVRDMTEYRAEEFAAEASVPLDEVKRPDYIFNMQGVIDAVQDALANLPFIGGGSTPSGPSADYGAQRQFAGSSNAQARAAALDWAKANVVPGSTRYEGAGSGPNRYNLPSSADCSGLVAAAYKGIGLADEMGWSSYPGTHSIISQLNSNGWKNAQRLSYDDIFAKRCQYGDLLIRPGHIRFFDSYTGSGSGMNVFDAASKTSSPQVGGRVINSLTRDYFVIRPMPLGSDMSYNAPNQPRSGSNLVPV